jgi:hypothetical protein
MRVYISNCNSNAFGKASPCGCLFGQITGSIAELTDWVLNLVFGKAGEILVQRTQEFATWILAILEVSFVTGGAGIANIVATELPDNPVGCFDKLVHRVVNLWSLLKKLQAYDFLYLQ